MPRHAYPVLLMLVAGACRPLDEVPEDLDEAVHAFWTAFPEGPEASANLLVPLESVSDEASLEDGYFDGELSPLSREQQGLVTLRPADGVSDDGWTPPDPVLASPMLFYNRFPCTPERMLEILVEPDQNGLYATYDDYERRFDDGHDEFVSGSRDTSGWEGTIEATIPVPSKATYIYGFRAEILRMTVPDGHPSAGQTAYVVRNWMPSPASWDNENRSFSQDYQLEIYVPWEGDILHVYGMWREMWVGDLLGQRLDMTNAAFIQTMRGQLVKWDKTTAEHCAADTLPTRVD